MMMGSLIDSKSLQHEAVLSAFIGYLMSPSPVPLEKLFSAIHQRSRVRSIYLLLDNQNPGNLHQFMSYTLPRILEQLHHTTVRVNVDYQGRVRGRVVWPATYKARFSQDYNPNLYSCRQVQPFFDTLENQLLKHVIEEMHRWLQSVPDAIRSGFMAGLDKRALLPIVTRLQVLETRMHEILRNIYLRQITSITQITPLHLQRAENSRLEEYTAIVDLYRHLFERPDWHPFHTEGQRFLLLPDRVTPETEVWIQAAATLVRTYQLHEGD